MPVDFSLQVWSRSSRRWPRPFLRGLPTAFHSHLNPKFFDVRKCPEATRPLATSAESPGPRMFVRSWGPPRCVPGERPQSCGPCSRFPGIFLSEHVGEPRKNGERRVIDAAYSAVLSVPGVFNARASCPPHRSEDAFYRNRQTTWASGARLCAPGVLRRPNPGGGSGLLAAPALPGDSSSLLQSIHGRHYIILH